MPFFYCELGWADVVFFVFADEDACGSDVLGSSVDDRGHSVCIEFAEFVEPAGEASEVEVSFADVGIFFIAAERRVGDDLEGVFEASSHAAAGDADVLAVVEEVAFVPSSDEERGEVFDCYIEVSAVFGAAVDELFVVFGDVALFLGTADRFGEWRRYDGVVQSDEVVRCGGGACVKVSASAVIASVAVVWVGFVWRLIVRCFWGWFFILGSRLCFFDFDVYAVHCSQIFYAHSFSHLSYLLFDAVMSTKR